MFGTEGDGEENGNGLSAVCSGLFCLLLLQLKEWGIYICFLVIRWTIPKKTNRKCLLIGNSLQLGIDITKSELCGSVPNGFGRICFFFFNSGKKWTILKRHKDTHIVMYWYNMCFLFVYGIPWFFMMSKSHGLFLLLGSVLNLYKIKLSSS